MYICFVSGLSKNIIYLAHYNHGKATYHVRHFFLKNIVKIFSITILQFFKFSFMITIGYRLNRQSFREIRIQYSDSTLSRKQISCIPYSDTYSRG